MLTRRLTIAGNYRESWVREANWIKLLQIAKMEMDSAHSLSFIAHGSARLRTLRN